MLPAAKPPVMVSRRWRKPTAEWRTSKPEDITAINISKSQLIRKRQNAPGCLFLKMDAVKAINAGCPGSGREDLTGRWASSDDARFRRRSRDRRAPLKTTRHDALIVLGLSRQARVFPGVRRDLAAS